MINNRIIPLKFNKKDFEEIYFRDNQGSLFFSPANKSMTITAIVFAIVLGFLYLFNLISIDNIGIYYFLSFIFLICILRLFAGISQTLRWKKGIFQYLKSFKNNTVFELELMDDFLIINIDYQE